jgi:A-kinase anchor protein 18
MPSIIFLTYLWFYLQEILVEVDAQVAEKEKEDRKLEIYNRIDAKSFTNFRGQKKFKKSDILSANRRLR